MRIHVDDSSKLDLRFIALEATSQFVAKHDQEGHDKNTPDGKTIYAARALSALRVVDGQPAGADQSVSLGLTDPPKGIAFGTIYRLDGPADIVHYVQQNGRLGVSITGTSVVPANGPAGKPQQGGEH